MSMIGKTLGNFECTALLGKGGMGEVYQATDKKLGRDVAIKVLPEEFARDSDRVARFQREAKLLASLNHTNIAAIYGLEESEGTHFLVLELIEGDTLADRLKRGAVPVEESLKLALQITEALEAAHEKGVIHRDLKPANIKVTPDGKVKVLDFGLAKAFAGEQDQINLSNSPTLSQAMTMQGMILGTAAYMSPEQARGKTVDKRADVWAFGAVLYEMLTGRQAFQGEDVSETLASVIKGDTNLDLLPANIHPKARETLERCLEKDIKNRYHDIADVRVDISRVLSDPGGVLAQSVSGAKERPKLQQILPWIAATLILTAIIAGVAVWKLKPTEPRRIMRFDYHLPGDQQFSQPVMRPTPLAISPDGSHFVYGTTEGFYLRDFEQMEARLIPGTNESSITPFFSPDGQWIGYLARDEAKLKKISISGGAPIVLCDARSVFTAIWYADNSIVYAAGEQGIARVSADGGTPEILIEFKEDDFGFYIAPQILPDGKHLLFTHWTPEESKIFVQSLESDERKELIIGNGAQYLPTGHLVYWLDNNLYAAPFDPDALDITGGSVSIVEGVAINSISNEGTLIYIPGTRDDAGRNLTLLWVDREGNEKVITNIPGQWADITMSYDGTQVALAYGVDGNSDIWTWDITREIMARLTFNAAEEYTPLWTPDSRRIVFTSERDGKWGIYWKAADGTGETELIASVPEDEVWPWSWSGDGESILLTKLVRSSRQADIEILSMEGDRARKVLFNTEYTEAGPQISPDGKWMAYTSNESGQPQIYVRAFPKVNEGKWQVSQSGGHSPLWSPDGRELFYRNDDATIAVSVETKPTFKPGKTKVLFQGEYHTNPLAGVPTTAWDIAPDGMQFIIAKQPQLTDSESTNEAPRIINIVLNWFEELKERVPVD